MVGVQFRIGGGPVVMIGKLFCGVCNQRSTPDARVFRFEETLRELDIPARHAHPSCIVAERKRRQNVQKKTGRIIVSTAYGR